MPFGYSCVGLAVKAPDISLIILFLFTISCQAFEFMYDGELSTI